MISEIYRDRVSQETYHTVSQAINRMLQREPKEHIFFFNFLFWGGRQRFKDLLGHDGVHFHSKGRQLVKEKLTNTIYHIYHEWMCSGTVSEHKQVGEKRIV